MEKNRRKWPRAALMAAALAVCTIGAAATVWSLREAARADMGLEQALPEWREYEEAPAGEEGTVTLDSTLCSGDQLDAYLRVSGVDPEVGASLEAKDYTYQWDIGSLDYQGNCSLGVEHVAYEAETETALVRLHIKGIAEADKIAFGLSLCRGLEAVRKYEPVEIPVTDSGALQAEIDFTLPQEDGYRGALRATQVQVHASYVEVAFEVSPFRSVAEPEELEDTEDIRYPDGRVENTARDALVAYLDSLDIRAAAALADATLHYADGSSETIAAKPSQYKGSWLSDQEGAVEELRDLDHVTFRHVTRQAIDLGQVVAVTIGGVEYPLG